MYRYFYHLLLPYLKKRKYTGFSPPRPEFVNELVNEFRARPKAETKSGGVGAGL